MRPGYNPIRRNRNLGTAKLGRGSNNRLNIPSLCHDERVWWEELGYFTPVERMVNDRKLLFIVERTNPGFLHACTVDDICHLLATVPSRDWEGLGTFALRQPTRKQSLLSGSWGRFAYWADLGRPGKKSVHSGPVIFLEAMKPSALWRWPKELDPAAASEIERLVSDGHKVEDTGRYFVFHSSPAAIRTTQLYRTLLHEVGHWVDWSAKVLNQRPNDAEEWYFSRPVTERETFAHRYADARRKDLASKGLIPFARIFDSDRIARDGLTRSDFEQ